MLPGLFRAIRGRSTAAGEARIDDRETSARAASIPGDRLGTCCIGSALTAVNSPDLKTELGIAPDVTVVAAIVVGVPAGAPLPTSRKPPAIITWKKLAS